MLQSRVNCTVCGKEFISYRNVQKRCSPECNREWNKARLKQRALENPEEGKERSRRWKEANPERWKATQAAYSESHRAEAAARTRAWSAANPERKKTNDRAYYQAIRDPATKYRLPFVDEDKRWAHIIMSAIRSYSKERNHPSPTITVGWLIDQFEKQSGRCYWTGVPMVPSEIPLEPHKPSPDRLDCTRGYEPDNVVLTTFFANRARMDIPSHDFEKLIAEIVEGSQYAHRNAKGESSPSTRIS